MDSMLSGGVVVNLAARNESTVIIQVADHPFVLACEFEVGLPEAVAIRPFESTFTPDLSRSHDWMAQSSFDEDSMDGVVTNRGYTFASIVLEVAFNFAWTPMLLLSKPKYEIHSLLWRLPIPMRLSRLDR